MARVTLDHVTKHFGGIVAVRDVTLTIADGEFLVLLGPSGCGKTTTLRMIAGLETPTAGRIWIGERDVTGAEPKDRDIAMVFQNYALYPHMSVFDNMAFGLKLRKVPRAEIVRRVEEAATLLGLQELLHRKPRELSGGQRQRVALGRAIVREPAVFLMDEPLSNLDAQLRTATRVELKRLHQRLGATVVYVTHDQVEAMTLGTRIVVMRDGVVQQVGTPEEIYRRPRTPFVAQFVGTPPMNLIGGVVARKGTEWILSGVASGSLPLPETLSRRLEQLSSDQVLLGVRPEDMVLTSGGLWPGTVRVVEPLGYETLVYVDVGATQVVVRTGRHPTIAVGETVGLEIPADRWHVFDPARELLLEEGAESAAWA